MAVPKADHIFRHIGAIQDEQAHLFAGRDDVIAAVLQSLEQSGAIPVIYGDRGIGKSSVAWRIFNMLRFKDTLPEFGKVTSQFDLDENYIPLWVECGDWFSGIESVLLSLLLPKGLRQAVTIRDLFPDILSDDQKARAEASFELNLAIFKAGMKLGAVDDRDAIARALRAASDKALADPIEMFSQVGARLLDQFSSSTMVIFIDEFDRLPDKSMVGSVLKTLTKIRFVIVGVGKTSAELIGSHSSIDRKVANVNVPPFSDEEAGQIFDNARRASLSFDGSKGIQFSDRFQRTVISDTGGYPNLIQKVGFHCVQNDRLHKKMLEVPVEISMKNYIPALKTMFKAPNKRGAAEDEVETNLSEAVGDSTRRTALLKAMVALGNRWVSVAELLNQLSKKNHQHLHDNLEIFVNKGVLVVRDDDQYRFTSPMYLMAASLMLEAADAAEPPD